MTNRLSSHEKLSFKLTNIICVIQGTSQTGSENNFPFPNDYHSYFFRSKVPWGPVEGLWLRHSIQILNVFLYANFTVIDMMVDPDGTLDVLSNLGLTSPLTDQKINSGTQQGAMALHPGDGASCSIVAASRPEGQVTESYGPSDHAEVAERDPGPQQSSRSFNW